MEPGEDPQEAVRREVAEETGLRVLAVRYAHEAPYPSGRTSCYRVEVTPGAPRLGRDPEPECDCPRMVGLIWVPLACSPATAGGTEVMVPTLLMPAPA
ncbi:NUDIX hydrolase [Streptomyces cirratus]|uniref:NUDIX hydrolase n=1 Tax=Streptomyces cirratus TaxID=68187 RepID=UPI003570C8CC